MANTIWLVSHSYAAPPSADLVGNICMWNTKRPNHFKHHRKLLESAGASVVDESNQLLANQEITFIGEWECCSSFVPCGQKSPFNRVHAPIYSQCDARIANLMNTDPYVFGKQFYWICCKQPKDKARIHIGDIVIFGSYTLSKGVGTVDKMVIDTVLVVDEVIAKKDFKTSNYSQCYNDVTIAHTDTKWSGFYMVHGKRYDPTKSYEDNVPFSFVPCRRKANVLMDKLIIDRHLPIAELGGRPLRIGQNGGHLDIRDNLAAWNAIVDAIRTAGCDLGVFMPEPALTTGNAVINSNVSHYKLKSQNAEYRQRHHFAR